MAYFLKKSNLKKGVYLQIYESFYDRDKKETAHKSYKAIGYVQDLIDSGIPDPIGYYSDVVKQMNIEAKRIKEENAARQIAASPERHLGYFLLHNIYDSLHVFQLPGANAICKRLPLQAFRSNGSPHL